MRHGKRSMIEFGTSAPVALGICFVEKQNKKLRLIVDARRLNQRCRTPPQSHWRVGTFCLHLRLTSRVFCMWRKKMLQTVATACVFPLPCAVSLVCLPSRPDISVSPGDMTVPRCCTLPLGFAWSLYFAQRAHEHVLDQGSTVYRAENRLSDRKPFRKIESGDPYHLQYVDNLGVLG